MKPVVSIVKYENLSSISKAIELCNGFKDLKPTNRVLIKPNIAGSGSGFIPPYGMVTTTKVIEGTVKALKDFGVSDISIGEGTVLDELGTNTKKAMEWIQLPKLAKKYGLKLLDFNAGPHRKIASDDVDVTINVAEAVFETDFFINLPVLKTHTDARVSLASKNLKGCMAMASKKFFHGEIGALHYRISRLMEIIPQHLVIIDGIYVMEKGPDPTIGTGHPRGILVSSSDFFTADTVGARLLGAKSSEVKHLLLYAQRNGRMDVLENEEAIEVRGESVKDHAKYVPWETDLFADFKEAGHTGMEVRLIGECACSGCYANYDFPVLLLSALSHNKRFNDTRFVTGHSYKDDQNSPHTILFGNCAIKENKHLDKATKLAGCPPKFWDSFFFIVRRMEGLHNRIAFYFRFVKFMIKATLGIGILPLPRYEIYKNNPGYNKKHFVVE